MKCSGADLCDVRCRDCREGGQDAMADGGNWWGSTLDRVLVVCSVGQADVLLCLERPWPTLLLLTCCIEHRLERCILFWSRGDDGLCTVLDLRTRPEPRDDVVTAEALEEDLWGVILTLGNADARLAAFLGISGREAVGGVDGGGLIKG